MLVIEYSIPFIIAVTGMSKVPFGLSPSYPDNFACLSSSSVIVYVNL